MMTAARGRGSSFSRMGPLVRVEIPDPTWLAEYRSALARLDDRLRRAVSRAGRPTGAIRARAGNVAGRTAQDRRADGPQPVDPGSVLGVVHAAAEWRLGSFVPRRPAGAVDHRI